SRVGAHWDKPQQLTRDGGAWPHWSPDGKSIAYTVGVAPPRGGLAVISPDGLAQRIVVESKPLRVPQYSNWSPDGHTIYFKALDVESRLSLWSVPASGGDPKMIVDFGDPLRTFARHEFAVSDKEFLFTITEREADIWILKMLD